MVVTAPTTTRRKERRDALLCLKPPKTPKTLASTSSITFHLPIYIYLL